MRIMTSNLWNIHASPAAFAAALDEHRPNVVAVQELAPAAADVLESRYRYGIIRPGGVEGHAFVADRPVDVTSDDIPFRPFISAPIDIGGRSVTVAAVHIANPVAVGDLPHRARQVQAVLERVRGSEPMVLVGDLNSSPAWPAYQALRRHLDDGVAAWASTHGLKPKRTWNYRPGLPKALRIDHVLVREVTVKDVAWVDIAGSDHRSIVADLI